MTTFHRRRQWRDRRAQPTLADLARADSMIRVYGALTGLGVALLVLIALFGDKLLNALFGDC
jgi:hypothetical protein